MYMLVVPAIKKDPSLCPTAKFLDNPCLLAIYPTKHLEHQMVCQIQVDIIWINSHPIPGRYHGLKGLVINADTIQEAQTRSKDIWEKAQMEPNMIFLAPKQLISKGFDDLSKDDSPFTAQICVVAVDEAHLLNTWCASWRKAFQQIGWVQA